MADMYYIRKLSEIPPFRIFRGTMNRPVRHDCATTNREHVRAANPEGSLAALWERTRGGEER